MRRLSGEVGGSGTVTKHTIVAHFRNYGAAHRAFCELLTSGVEAEDISLIAGDRSNSRGADRDFGILADEADLHSATIRRGVSLLAVRADARSGDRIAGIIAAHAPGGAEAHDEDGAAAMEHSWRH